MARVEQKREEGGDGEGGDAGTRGEELIGDRGHAVACVDLEGGGEEGECEDARQDD